MYKITHNFPVDAEAANLLRTCYGETGVMDFGFNWLTELRTRFRVGVRVTVRGPI